MRLGLAVGFGTGYYLGAKAGRERYEDINRLVAKVKRSEAYDTASEKAKAVVDLGVERARDLVEDHGPGGSDTPHPGHTNGTGPVGVPLIPGGEG